MRSAKWGNAAEGEGVVIELALVAGEREGEEKNGDVEAEVEEEVGKAAAARAAVAEKACECCCCCPTLPCSSPSSPSSLVKRGLFPSEPETKPNSSRAEEEESVGWLWCWCWWWLCCCCCCCCSSRACEGGACSSGGIDDRAIVADAADASSSPAPPAPSARDHIPPLPALFIDTGSLVIFHVFGGREQGGVASSEREGKERGALPIVAHRCEVRA